LFDVVIAVAVDNADVDDDVVAPPAVPLIMVVFVAAMEPA
jgi:hypothetical protein